MSDGNDTMEETIRTTLRIKGIRLHDSVIRALAREARIAYEAEAKRREADRAPRWAR